MPYKFNPFTQTLDETPGLVTSTNAGLLPAGFSYENDVFNVPGDINLDDGVAGFETTLQTITPTANRTISFPDASGTVALIGGTNGQVTYNAAGAQAGLPTLTTDGTNLTLAGRLTNTFTSLADAPAKLLSGTWFTGGTPTTNKPHFLIEPAGTTSTAWSTLGTGLGVNAASGFTGKLLDLQLNGAARLDVAANGKISFYNEMLAAFNATPDSQLIGIGRVSNRLQLCSTFGVIMRWGATEVCGTTSATNFRIAGSLSFAADSSVFGGTPANQVFVRADADNIFAQRNGTNAQTYRVYNTWTSSTNNELGKLEWSSNVFRIGTEKGSGGGTARDMAFQTDGTTRATIDTNGTLLVGTSTARTNFSSGTPRVQIEGVSTSSSQLSVVVNTPNSNWARLNLGKTRNNGTTSGMAAVIADDGLGSVDFSGADGTEFIRGATITAYVDGTPGPNDMPGRLVFSTTADESSTPTERMRITSDAYVRLASGTGGIQFNGDTAAANALDDYEEGTFTPTITAGITDITYDTPNTLGVYRIIGKQLFFSLRVRITAGTTNGSQLRVAGLPVSILNGSIFNFTMPGRFVAGASATNLHATGYASQTYLEIYDCSDRSAVTGTEAGSTMDLTINGSYPRG